MGITSWGDTHRLDVNRRSFLVGLSVAGVGLGMGGVLSACASDDGGGGGGGSDRLRSGIAEWGSGSFDPVLIAASSAWEILTPIYDSVLHLDAQGNFAPGVAESWEFSDDNRQVTFHIRQGMKFHDGSELTASDVKFSLVRWYDPALQALALPVYDFYVGDPENDITVVDDYTLTVATTGPADIFIQTLSLQQTGDAYVLPQKYVEADYEKFLKSPIGTGPFKFKELNAGESVVYEATGEAHPFRESPGFKELEIVLVAEESTRMAMLQTDAIDIISISPESVAGVEEIESCEVGEAPVTIQQHLFFQGAWAGESEAGKLADVRVREALSLAINREEVVETLLAGFGKPVQGNVPGEFFPGMGDLDIDFFPGDMYDVDRAKELLAEAGVGEGDLQIPIWAFDISGAPWLHSLGEVYLGYWQELGVTGEIKPTDLATFIGMCELDQLDERTIGTLAAFRRRVGFELGQAVQGYDPRETPGGSMMGPPDQSVIPDIVDRVESAIGAEGDERVELCSALLKEGSEAWLMPMVFYASALWGIGNRAASYTLTERSQTLGQVYETVKPA
jgi:ABC-type transport system substrate-binding protein